jgi:hypothetical protein
MSHTPGPWERNGVYVEQERKGAHVICSCYCGHNTDGTSRLTEKDAIANACLIAAAPELLAVCLRALEYAPNEVEANIVRVAIAKATKVE